ncbi:MAG: hypothetical protein DRJ45_07970 [Thermoprotei archaeon]|nr:MAG: hypothetical protein DRJ45_07970 [Thermoprotei archaeon]
MKKACAFLLSIFILFWAVSAKASPYGTNAWANVQIDEESNGQMDEHEASASIMSNNNYAEAKASAWLYHLKGFGYADIHEEALAYSAGESEFWDTYTVIAPEGVESVRIGMRIKLNGILQGEGYGNNDMWDTGFNVYVYLNREIPLYEAYAGLSQNNFYVDSSSGNLDIDDFTSVPHGYKLSDFTDIIYFFVEPGEFWINYSLYAGVYIGGEVLSTGWAMSDFYYSANFEIFPADPNIISLNSESGQGVVPIPSTLLLLGSGLVGILAIRKSIGI